ncbi:hypothetical protein C8J57DRAFT_1498684 [Mycena rebaudengoi]|nr:hypothetical protein C8J57DRAFT_1498684 [Mycena rebaudengoi]
MSFSFCLAVVSLALFTAVGAFPTWQGLNYAASINSLVSGASYIEAIGPFGAFKSLSHLSSHIPGEPGNLTVLSYAELREGPPLFSLSQNQFWQYKNETTIYPVNVINTTMIAGVPPLQIVIGGKRAGMVTGGKWRWQGTMLHYDIGSRRASQVFYKCETGIFMFLEPSLADARGLLYHNSPQLFTRISG